MPSTQPRGTRWVFTLNNPTEGEKQLIADYANSDHCTYCVVGRETGESGTPHLQGFIIFKDRKYLSAAKHCLSDRAHLEVARGNNNQAADYCKKEGDYDEYGSINSQGKRNDFEAFRDWILAADQKPKDCDVIQEFPSLYGRYRVSCMRMVEVLWSPRPMDESELELRPWQRQLHERLLGEPDDRTINFVVDATGGKGKSWFAHYLWRQKPHSVQRFEFGKRDDYAYSLDPSKSIYLFDVPRGKMEYFSYGIAESIKNKFVFSGKYDSCSKYLDGNAHVVVFANEYPNMEKLSIDRYNIINLNV